MVSLHSRTTSFFLFFVSSTAATLFLSPSSCQATGSNYRDVDNDDIYTRLGVRPPDNHNRVLKLMGVEFPVSRWSWKIHGSLLPLLHFFDDGGRGSKSRDSRRPPDVFVNLRVLWCKLLTSLDPDSPAYEGKPRSVCNSDDSNDNNAFATYRMLPAFSIKWPLRHLGLWRIFPRWMHANIELRTMYLQGALEKVLAVKHNDEPETAVDNANTACSSGDRQPLSSISVNGVNFASEEICVIVLGGGYDPRGAKLAATNGIRRVYEIDLPVVVESKRRLLLRAGFRVMHDNDNDNDNDNDDYDKESLASERADLGVRLEGVDLNDDAAVDRVLDKIQRELISISERVGDSNERCDSDSDSDSNESAPASACTRTTSKGTKIRWRIVVISEAVLMYLQPGKPSRVLEGLAERFRRVGNPNESHFTGASFLFADRLIRSNGNNTTRSMVLRGSSVTQANFNGGEDAEIQQWLQKIGWKLQELLYKPGATRHLGIAKTL